MSLKLCVRQMTLSGKRWGGAGGASKRTNKISPPGRIHKILQIKTAHRIYVHLNAKNCLVHGGRVNSELATRPSRDLVTRESERIVPTRPTPARRRSKEGAAAGGEGAGPLPTDLCGRACGVGGLSRLHPVHEGGGALRTSCDYAIIQAGAGSLVTPVTAQACGALCRMRTIALTLSSPTTRVCLSAAACSAG